MTPCVAPQAHPGSPAAQGSFFCPTPTTYPLRQLWRQSWAHISDAWIKMLHSLFMEKMWDHNNVILENVLFFSIWTKWLKMCLRYLCPLSRPGWDIVTEKWNVPELECKLSIHLTHVFYPIYDSVTMEEEAKTEGKKELPTKGKLFPLWPPSYFTVNIYRRALLVLFISPFTLTKQFQNH